MKSSLSHSMPLSVAERRTGAALVMTLGMLVLLSGVVLAFLLMVRTEYGASKAYEGGTNARLLADSALNLVIGQIREASTQPNLAWISQPGLLRTFDTSGKAVKSYKLYSADSLVEDGSFDPAKGADLPAALPVAGNWKTQPGLWADMNQAVTDLARNDPFDSTKKKKLMVFPIFDGNHVNSAGQLSLNKDGNQDVEGCTIDQFASRGVTMPVKWLYILKDGTLVPAKASGSVGDVEVVVPTDRQKTAQGEANTVVGRVAFWTDDETAKVNINTASEGTFSDTPVGNSQPGMRLPAVNYQTSNDSTFEWDLAERMGAQKEYQRYPGHPATTCLSTIFGRQLSMAFGNTGNLSTDRALMIEEINKMIPRVSGAYYSDPFYSSLEYDYSSKGGTKRAGPAQGRFNEGQSSLDETPYPVIPDGDRLYASIDEFFFSPMFATTRRAWTLAPPASGRDTTREVLEMSKFFLTANSKAPEQNSFNLPRISVWPEQVADARRTAVDKLIAFCATVGPKTGTSTLPFYFTRQDANNPTADVSGSSGARNLALMAYLKGLTGRQYPGWNSAKTFRDKYGTDRDQILTEMFDYIRCTNLADRSDPNAPDSAFTNTVENGPTQVFPSVPSLGMGSRGQVVPIEMPDGTRGMGRIITISELALVMIGNNNKVEFSLIPKLFSPMAGFSALSMGMRITFTKIDIDVKDASGAGRNPFTQDGVTVASQPTLYDIGRMSNVEDNEGKIGGTLGFHSICEGGTGRRPQNQGSPPQSVPPTGEMQVAGSQLTISGTVTAELSVTNPSSGPRSSGEPVYQTITFMFPSQTVPVPGSGGDMAAGGTGAKSRGGRIAGGNGAGIDGNDTIRSLVAVGKNLQGDLRIVAAMKNVDETYFQPGPNGAYQDSSRRNNQNHSLRSGWPGNYSGSAFGQLEPTITQYGGEGQPDIPAGITGVLNSLGQLGDWDNGPAFLPDGPYCNKPDEGTRRHQHAQGPYAEDSTPYIGWWWNPQDTMQQQTTFFSPNRLISSPVMFGSLPTGVKANKPWQTLLFRPAKTYFPGGINHPGSISGGMPPDHLLLDLFWMPVAEPYAVSEPFATAGKINLNQQIAPFTNIKRDTGLRAVMKSVKISALNPNQPDGAGGVYSQRYKLCGTVGLGGSSGGGRGVVVRRNIDLDNTLKQITDRYATNKPFVSASEICDIPLIPQELPTVAAMQPHVSAGFSTATPLAQFDSLLTSFWSQHKLTGDNSLERPYSYIYPRLTTRSNSYTVHVRVQTLPRSTRNSGYVLKATQNQPTGEFRGSFLIERYLDANSANIVDSAGNPKSVPASGDTTGLALGPYRFRVVSSRQFVP